MSAPPRVVPTLTEVLDEARLRPQEPAPQLVLEPQAPALPSPSELASAPVSAPVSATVSAPVLPAPPRLPREESALVPELGPGAAFAPFPEPAPAPLALADFDLDLNLGGDPPSSPPSRPSPAPWAEVPVPAAPAPAPAAPRVDQAFLDSLEAGLRQRAGLALELALDELLEQQLRQRIEQAMARQGELLLQELRELLAPRLESLVEQALADVLRQERERLGR